MIPRDGYVLVLRTSEADGKSHGGFQWPSSGPVECADWSPAAECGNGLHGCLRGEGDGSLFSWGAGSLWQVVEVLSSDVVDLGGKVKFPRGEVVYSGTRLEATRHLQETYPEVSVIGGTATAGSYGTATAGFYGTATAGSYGTATAGSYGTATAGSYGTATAGYGGTATAGSYGTATAGDRGTATAGDRGTATAGYGGTATAGDRGTIVILHHDGTRYRVVVGYVGEGGIEANVPYVVKKGHLTREA